LVLADRYDIETARLRLRPSLVEFAETGLPERRHRCRPGFEDEVKIPPSHTASIDFLGLTELPDEFKFIPVMEYHRFILLHGELRVREPKPLPQEFKHRWRQAVYLLHGPFLIPTSSRTHLLDHNR
jgi:hypothetical protein